MAARWRVLFLDLRELLGQKAIGDTNEQRPEAAVNQSDPAIDEPTDENLLGHGNGSKDLERCGGSAGAPTNYP